MGRIDFVTPARRFIHTVEDAPAASRPRLQNFIRSSPMGRFLNLHAQMAHSPAVLAAYTSLRTAVSAISAFGTKRTSHLRSAMSAFGGKADIARVVVNVRF
jgi:hypothetical protein